MRTIKKGDPSKGRQGGVPGTEERWIQGMVFLGQALQAFWLCSCIQVESRHCTKKMVLMGMVRLPAGSPGGVSGTWNWIQGWLVQMRAMITRQARVSARLSSRVIVLVLFSSHQPMGSCECLRLWMS